MAKGAGKNKDAERAKSLKASGYPHGRRMTRPSPNLPNPLAQGFTAQVGSAASRRLQQQRRAS